MLIITQRSTQLRSASRNVAEFEPRIIVARSHFIFDDTTSCFLLQILMMADILNMTQTAFTILSGQGEALNIDPQHFYSHVYKLLPQLSTGMCVLIQTMPAHHMHETWVLLIYCSGLTAQLLLCVSVSINILFLISS